jgi:Pilus formation protein N terminal region
MRFVVGALLTLVVLGSPAMAEDFLSLTWRKAEILELPVPPGTIIIGDPSVIDVSIEPSGMMLLFGKQPGETNMIIFDASGRETLFNGSVVVAPESNRHVSIISATRNAVLERTWNCVARCVQVIGPGSIPYKAVEAESGDSAPAPSSGAGQPNAAQQAAAGTAGAAAGGPSVTIDNSAGASGGGISAPY